MENFHKLYNKNNMKKIKDIISEKLKDQKQITSKRQHLLQRICDDFFTDKEFTKIMGQTKNLTEDEIEKIYVEAKNWKTNSVALFWKLLREKQQKIKKQLKK